MYILVTPRKPTASWVNLQFPDTQLLTDEETKELVHAVQVASATYGQAADEITPEDSETGRELDHLTDFYRTLLAKLGSPVPDTTPNDLSSLEG